MFSKPEKPEPPASLLQNVLRFGRVLRRTGMPLGTNDLLNAVQALMITGLEKRGDVYWALHTTLLRHQENRTVFDQAFHIFWRRPELLETLIAPAVPEGELSASPTERLPLQRRLAEALAKAPYRDRTENPDKPVSGVESDARESFSAKESLRYKDFEQMSLSEQVQARTALRDLALPVKPVPSRRYKPDRTGPLLDAGRSFRQTLRNPDMIALVRKTPRHRHPPLVVLLDISGSMSVYARMVLHFLHALIHSGTRIHVFLFGTRLTNVTRPLHDQNSDAALRHVASLVEDWDGGTRIGIALRRFNVDWAKRVAGRGSSVLLITDGLDRDAGEGLEPEIRRLKRLSKKLIWLNPLLRYDQFEPRATGIRIMLPHVDDFRPAHNLESFSALAGVLSASSPRTGQHTHKFPFQETSPRERNA